MPSQPSDNPRVQQLHVEETLASSGTTLDGLPLWMGPIGTGEALGQGGDGGKVLPLMVGGVKRCRSK